MQGWKLNFFLLLFPVCFSTQKKILSEASKDKKAVRRTLKDGGVSLYSAQENVNSAVRLCVFSHCL